MSEFHQPSPIVLQQCPPSLAEADPAQPSLLDKAAYEKKLKKWQQRLLEVQQAYFHQGRRTILLFEGWDASGKGGAIRRITEKLDPRGFQVHPMAAPRSDEQSRHYLYRFQKRLPHAGMMAIFDRSYYGRVLVERVEAFASDKEWQRAYQEINEFERQLTDDGARIIKFFLHISPEEQLKRFVQRLNDPVKQWKLTEEDIRNRQKWFAYEAAIEDMFRKTSTENSPWHLIASNHKWYTRIETLKRLVKTLSEGVNISPPPMDKKVIAAAVEHLGLDPDTLTL